MQESGNRVEYVAALEKSTKHLRIVAVQELSAKLDRVTSGYDGEGVAYLRALEHFINARSQEERMTKAESRTKAHSGIGGGNGGRRPSRSTLYWKDEKRRGHLLFWDAAGE